MKYLVLAFLSFLLISCNENSSARKKGQQNKKSTKIIMAPVPHIMPTNTDDEVIIVIPSTVNNLRD